MSSPKDPPTGLTRSPRGYRIGEFAAREQVDRVTVWRWMKKGALKVSRIASKTGVRVDYPDDEEDADR